MIQINLFPHKTIKITIQKIKKRQDNMEMEELTGKPIRPDLANPLKKKKRLLKKTIYAKKRKIHIMIAQLYVITHYPIGFINILCINLSNRFIFEFIHRVSTAAMSTLPPRDHCPQALKTSGVWYGRTTAQPLS